jgi:hypothetical protein
MKKLRFIEAQIIGVLREAEADVKTGDLASILNSSYPCKLQTTRPHIKVTAEKLADGVDLVIVTAVRKARDLDAASPFLLLADSP